MAIQTLDHAPKPEDDFPEALRRWRRLKHMSQLELSLSSGVSARHVSFLETGRARPSREMVLQLADALTIPRGARNAFLIRAGFAPLYPQTPLDSEALAPFRAAMFEMMRRHAPDPAILCDRHWTMLDANAPARALLGPLQGADGETNLVRMLAASEMAPLLIRNIGEVILEMLGRVRLEVAEAGDDPTLASLRVCLEEALARHPAPKATSPRRPLVPIVIAAGDKELKFLSSIAQFGTSEDVTVRDLRVELLFSADDVTRDAMAALAAG